MNRNYWRPYRGVNSFVRDASPAIKASILQSASQELGFWATNNGLDPEEIMDIARQAVSKGSLPDLEWTSMSHDLKGQLASLLTSTVLQMEEVKPSAQLVESIEDLGYERHHVEDIARLMRPSGASDRATGCSQLQEMNTDVDSMARNSRLDPEDPYARQRAERAERRVNTSPFPKARQPLTDFGLSDRVMAGEIIDAIEDLLRNPSGYAERRLGVLSRRFMRLIPVGNQAISIISNLTKKIDKGQYDREKADKLWSYLVDGFLGTYLAASGIVTSADDVTARGLTRAGFPKPMRTRIAQIFTNTFERGWDVKTGSFNPSLLDEDRSVSSFYTSLNESGVMAAWGRVRSRQRSERS